MVAPVFRGIVIGGPFDGEEHLSEAPYLRLWEKLLIEDYPLPGSYGEDTSPRVPLHHHDFERGPDPRKSHEGVWWHSSLQERDRRYVYLVKRYLEMKKLLQYQEEHGPWFV